MQIQEVKKYRNFTNLLQFHLNLNGRLMWTQKNQTLQKLAFKIKACCCWGSNLELGGEAEQFFTMMNFVQD